MGLEGGQVLLKKSIFCISDQTCENGHKDILLMTYKDP